MEAVASTFFLWPYPSGPATEAVTGRKQEADGCWLFGPMCETVQEVRIEAVTSFFFCGPGLFKGMEV